MRFNSLKLIIAAIILFSATLNAEGDYKREYSFISAVGADQPFSYGTNKVSPVFYFSYWQYYTDSKKSYCEVGATTTSVFAAIGGHNEKYNIGIKPIWGHSIYGAYADYNKGYTSSRNEIKGFYLGSDIYLNYNWSKLFSTGINYLPAYHYYTTESNANMVKPDSHEEHNAGVQLQLKNLSEKNLGIIKDGILAKVRYIYTYRSDYSFADRPINGTAPETSDRPSTHKYYADLGFYYNFENDYNIKFEINGSYQINTDRNNSEKIGSLVADNAVIPGYFFCEFYHDKYIISDLKFGIPLYIWQARIEPGYYILYMPKENKVIGVQDYPRRYYQSISLAFTMKVANLVPLFADYGYGINAERRSNSNDSVKKGSHEVRLFIVFAFGQA